MSSGAIHGLRKIQVGKETTKGTSVAATELLFDALADIEADLPLYRGQHPFGIMGEFGGPTKVLQTDVNIKLDIPALNYQQITWLLNAALDVPIDAAGPPAHHVYSSGIGAGSALIESGPTVPDSLTIEAIYSDGTDLEEFEIPYCMVRSFNISGEQGGPVKASVNLFGRDLVDAAITGGLVIPTNLEPIVTADGTFFINTTMALAAPVIAAGSWSPPAAGSWAGKIISFSLDVVTGLEPFHGIAGSTLFSRHQESTPKNFRLSVVSLQDAAVADSPAAERVAAKAGTMRFPTLNFVGAAGGAKFRFAGAAKHEKGELPTIGVQNGLDIVSMDLVGHHDPTAAGRMQFAVANAEATAP